MQSNCKIEIDDKIYGNLKNLLLQEKGYRATISVKHVPNIFPGVEKCNKVAVGGCWTTPSNP
jgi:hypothetical protein